MANLNNGSAIPASNSAVNSTVNNTNTNSLGGNSMTTINTLAANLSVIAADLDDATHAMNESTETYADLRADYVDAIRNGDNEEAAEIKIEMDKEFAFMSDLSEEVEVLTLGHASAFDALEAAKSVSVVETIEANIEADANLVKNVNNIDNLLIPNHSQGDNPMTNLNSAELNALIANAPKKETTDNTNNTQGENQMTNSNNSATPDTVGSNKTFRVWFVLMTFVLAGLASGNVDPDFNFDPTGGTGKPGKGAFRKVGKKFILTDEVKQEIANKAIFDINNLAGVAFAFQLVSPLIASMFPLSIANGINEVTGSRIGNFRLDFEDAIWTSKNGKYVVPDIKWERWNAWDAENTVETVEASIPNSQPVDNLDIIVEYLEDGTEVFVDPNAFNVKTLLFPAYLNPDAVTKLEVEYNNNAIRWGGQTYNFNERLIRVQPNFGFEIDDYDFKISSAGQVIAEILATLANKTQLREAQNFLNGLVGTVLISNWETEVTNPNNYNLAAIVKPAYNIVDAQQVLRENEVVAYHVNKAGLIILKKERENGGAWVKGCLKKTTEAWGFALPDKTNMKRAFVGDALTIMGVARNDNGIVSIVSNDKGGKFFNRHAMVKHIAAQFEEGVTKSDNLLSEISDGKFAASYGIRQNSLFITGIYAGLLSIAVGDGGFVIRNPITAISNKRIEGSINLDNLFNANDAYKAQVIEAVGNNRKAQLAYVMEDARKTLLNEYAGVSIAPNQSLKFQGQDIARNDSEVALVLSAKTPLVVSKGIAINTEIRTIKCTFRTKAIVVDYNYKVRGQWFKGMATRNDGVVVEGSEAEIIFNGNCVKNEKVTLIRMWANASRQMVAFCKDGEFRLVNFNHETQVFEKREIVDFDLVKKELETKFSKSLNVSFWTTKTQIDKFRKECPKFFHSLSEVKVGTEVKINELGDETFEISFPVKGYEAPLVYAVELSSVEENFAPGRNLSPIQAELLTTFNAAKETASGTIKQKAYKVARTIRLAATKKVDAHYDLRVSSANPVIEKTRDAWCSIFARANKNNNPRDMFYALAQKDKFPNGIKISGDTENGKRPWTVNIPFSIISALGAFNKNGFSFNNTVMETYAFLCLLADRTACPQLIADYAFALGGALDGWRKDVVTSKKAFTAGAAIFHTHGMKVLSSNLAGYEMHNGVSIPRILIDETNRHYLKLAVDKNGGKLKPIKNGDVVFFYRNPMVDLTPAIIRITENQSVCGAFTCAVAPEVLAWSSQTDNDGDVLWIVPANQVGINNVDVSPETSVKAASLMSHPLVSASLAERAMSAFNCDNLYEGIIKERNPVEDLNPTHKVTIDLVEEAENVAKHYKIRVGQGYSAMFNAYSSFIRKYNNGEEIKLEERVAIKACSFVLYEEWGLAGFTESNEANFKAIRNIAKAKLGVTKATPNSSFFNCFDVYQDLKEYPNHSFNDAVMDCAAVYVAQQMVQSKIEQSPNFAAGSKIREQALITGLFRTLAKGAYALDGNTISTVFIHASVDKNNNYAEALIEWKSFAANGLVIK